MDTATNSRATYDKTMEEFTDDVKYRLENAYELVKEEDDFRAKLYHAAIYIAHSTYCPCDGKWKHCCDNIDNYCCREIEQCRLREEEEELCRQRKLYHEMSKYDAFDAFLTEPVKNAICEDVLGEILTFL